MNNHNDASYTRCIHSLPFFVGFPCFSFVFVSHSLFLSCSLLPLPLDTEHRCAFRLHACWHSHDVDLLDHGLLGPCDLPLMGILIAIMGKGKVMSRGHGDHSEE